MLAEGFFPPRPCPAAIVWLYTMFERRHGFVRTNTTFVWSPLCFFFCILLFAGAFFFQPAHRMSSPVKRKRAHGFIIFSVWLYAVRVCHSEDTSAQSYIRRPTGRSERGQNNRLNIYVCFEIYGFRLRPTRTGRFLFGRRVACCVVSCVVCATKLYINLFGL